MKQKGHSSRACVWFTVSISPPKTSGLLPERLLPRRCAACFGMARRTGGPRWRHAGGRLLRGPEIAVEADCAQAAAASSWTAHISSLVMKASCAILRDNMTTARHASRSHSALPRSGPQTRHFGRSVETIAENRSIVTARQTENWLPREEDASELEVMRLAASSSREGSSCMEDTEASLGAYLDSVGLSWPCTVSSAVIVTDVSKASLGAS